MSPILPTRRDFRAKIEIEEVEDASSRYGSSAEAAYDMHRTNHGLEIDIPEKRYYMHEKIINTEDRYKNYLLSQMKRSATKFKKQRNTSHYKEVVEAIKASGSFELEEYKNMNMICMGARNKWEGQCFKKFLGVNAKTLDVGIGANSKAAGSMESNFLDYMMDFSALPAEWEEQWDIVFSNSIDHAADPTYTFFEWLRVLKTDGLLVLGIDPAPEEDGDFTDCAVLEEESVENFIDSTATVALLHKIEPSEKMTYIYYLLKKM